MALPSMPDFDDSTLWPVSGFERGRAAVGPVTSLLASTLQAELHALHRQQLNDDVLQVFAACVRLREAALVLLDCDGLVWPVTLFPKEMLYHSPQSLAHGLEGTLARLRVLDVEAPAARAPGPWMHERHAHAQAYDQLAPALWRMALQGPSARLIGEIGGTAAYRALRRPAEDNLVAHGAVGPAIEHMRREAMALRHLARLPGMSVDRASRLLNALYLTSNLVVSRMHPAARAQIRDGAGRRRSH